MQSKISRAQRGTILIAMVVALIVLSLVVVVVVTSGGRDHKMGGLQAQASRAQFCADSAAHMAVKEILDGVDRDDDGTIGTISNDSNTATDPAFNGTRMWATKSVSGSVTTVTARGQNGETARAVEVVVTGSAASPGSATVLLVVNNAAALDSQETTKMSLIQGWGYTVATISATASQASFDAAVLTSSVVYISETVTSTDVNTKLVNAPIGVVNEESSLSDEFGFAASMSTFTGNTVDIINNTHYITKVFPTGSLTIFSSGQLIRYMSGSLAPGMTTLGWQVSTTNVTFAVFERGDAMTPSGTAAGRRVYLPWGNTSMDINALTTDGKTLMQRSIEWCLLPVAYYALDDGSGTTAVDSIAGRNGTLSGVTWGTGKISGGAVFDGASSYISVPYNAVFDVTTQMTIAGWVNASAWPNNVNWGSIILRKNNVSPTVWELCVTQGKITMVLNATDATGIQGNTVLSLNSWHHVAATWDGATVRIYLDGVLDATPTSLAAPIPTDSGPVYIGGRSGNQDIVTGTVDDVRFYNRPLTAGEISALAGGSRPTITKWSAVVP